jgi:hypothetical protein
MVALKVLGEGAPTIRAPVESDVFEAPVSGAGTVHSIVFVVTGLPEVL